MAAPYEKVKLAAFARERKEARTAAQRSARRGRCMARMTWVVKSVGDDVQ